MHNLQHKIICNYPTTLLIIPNSVHHQDHMVLIDVLCMMQYLVRNDVNNRNLAIFEVIQYSSLYVITTRPSPFPPTHPYYVPSVMLQSL